MDTFRHHRSPRWLNARMRVARLTIPQWIAIGVTVALGAGLYVGLAYIPLLILRGNGVMYLRLLTAGAFSGMVGVLLYALADDRREPFIRQAVFYLVRRHRYDQEEPRGRTRCA